MRDVPWRLPRDMFSFVDAENGELYGQIMACFSEAALAQPTLTVSQLQNLFEQQHFPANSDERLRAALKQLRDWELIDESSNHSATYATFNEYYQNRSQWSLNPKGQAAWAGLLTASATLQEVAALQPEVLVAIAETLEALADQLQRAAPDRPRIAILLRELESLVGAMASSFSRFAVQLQSLSSDEGLTDSVFLSIKRQTVTYIHEFVSGIGLPAGRSADALDLVRSAGLERLLELGAEGANLAPVAGQDPRTEWVAQRRRQWEATEAWFAWEGPRKVGQFQEQATGAVQQLLRVLEQRRDARRRAASLKGDFQQLASWFATTADDSAAHRLFNAAFGLWPARHLSSVDEDLELVSASTSWTKAPAVEVVASLRTAGHDRVKGGRSAPVPDRSRQRKRKQAEEAERLAAEKLVRERLATDGPVELAAFNELDDSEFAEWHALFHLALTAERRHDGSWRAVTKDGAVNVTVFPPTDDRWVTITSPSGVLRVRNFAIDIDVAGVSAVSRADVAKVASS